MPNFTVTLCTFGRTTLFWHISGPLMRNTGGESEASFTCIKTKSFLCLCQSSQKHRYLKTCTRGVIDPWYITRCRISRKMRRLMETQQTSWHVFTQHIKPTVVSPTCLFHLSSYPWQYNEREHKQKPFSTFRKLGMWFPPEERRPQARMALMHREESSSLPWALISAHKPTLINWRRFFSTDPSFFIKARTPPAPEKQLCR